MSAGVVLDIQLYMHSERQYNILSVSLIYFRHILFRGVGVDRTVGWGGIMSGLDKGGGGVKLVKQKNVPNIIYLLVVNWTLIVLLTCYTFSFFLNLCHKKWRGTIAFPQIVKYIDNTITIRSKYTSGLK